LTGLAGIGLDRAIERWIVEHRWGPLDLLFEALSYIGSYGIVWLVIAVAISGFSWTRPWLWTRVGVAILISESVSGLLKDWIARDRPPLANPDPMPLVSLPATHSFPSGHATVSFACATTLALAVPRLRAPLYTLAALIAFSRVYVGVHYPLDVLAGATLGVGLAIALRMLGAILQRSAPPRRRG
jgi:undecaprenyl-diphosphatase